METTERKRYDLDERTFKFAELVISFARLLPRDPATAEIIRQVVRSSGSVGANYVEASESLGRKDFLIIVCNFTPMPRTQYRLGVPQRGFYQEVFNTDSEMFGGSNLGNGPHWLPSQDVFFHNQPQSIVITVPPLAVAVFRCASPLSLPLPGEPARVADAPA